MSLSELEEFAASKGVSSRQVKRWHLNGLLPQAHRDGIYISFPDPAAKAQLIAIIQIRKKERRFNQIRLQLWFEGHEVPHHLLVESLNIVCLSPLVRFLIGKGGNLMKSEKLARKVITSSGRSLLMARLRRKLSPADLHSAVVETLMIAMGDDSLIDTVGSVTDNDGGGGRLLQGLKPVRRPLAIVQAPMKNFWSSAPEALSELAREGLIVPAKMQKRLLVSTVEELETARHHVSTLCDRSPVILEKHDPYGLRPLLQRVSFQTRGLLTIFMLQIIDRIPEDVNAVSEVINTYAEM